MSSEEKPAPDEPTEEVVDDLLEEQSSEAASSTEAEATEPSDEKKSSPKTPEQERDEYKDRWLRSKAELDNFKKRSRRELTGARTRAHVDMSTGLLEVIDNLDRALEAVPEKERDQGLAQGVRMVREQLMQCLGSFGVERIDATGKAFDPHFHEALLEQETTDADPGTVLQELMPGYQLGENLIRAARVQVARAPKDAEKTTGEDD